MIFAAFLAILSILSLIPVYRNPSRYTEHERGAVLLTSVAFACAAIACVEGMLGHPGIALTAGFSAALFGLFGLAGLFASRR